LRVLSFIIVNSSVRHAYSLKARKARRLSTLLPVQSVPYLWDKNALVSRVTRANTCSERHSLFHLHMQIRQVHVQFAMSTMRQQNATSVIRRRIVTLGAVTDAIPSSISRSTGLIDRIDRRCKCHHERSRKMPDGPIWSKSF